MSDYFPNLVPPLRATSSRSKGGKTAGGGPSHKLDHLEEWEGYRVFRDPRSQTGWSDTSGHVIGGVDTNGYQLLYNPRTHALDYNQHHHGGFNIGSLASLVAPAVSAVSGGDVNPGGLTAVAENAASAAGAPIGTLQQLALRSVGLGQFSALIPAVDNLAGINATPRSGVGLSHGAGVVLGTNYASPGGDSFPLPARSTSTAPAPAARAGIAEQFRALLQSIFGGRR